jgi:capsular polysaccharide biosynthesis protein
MKEIKEDNKRIDLKSVFNTLLSNKKLFIIVWLVTFVLSCLWILPQPRYYVAKVTIAPESTDSKELGNLTSLAANFGVNLGDGNSDAIYPQLYPDLMQSTRFLVGLLDIKVKTKDGEVETDYYDYLNNYQKKNIIFLPFAAAKEWIQSLFDSEESDSEPVPIDGRHFNPFELSKHTNEIIEGVQSKVKCSYSMTTNVVTVEVLDQDPLVCALMADSIKEHLQVFLTDYRTKKARVDYEHYKKLTEEAKTNYEDACKKYASYSDSHLNVARKSFMVELQSLESDMQAKYNIYTAMDTRREAALAKVQERTPAFTELINATVPIKPAGPKRMIFVAVMLLLATAGTVLKLFWKELVEWF